MVRLNKIYTRTGDDGSTGLVGGGRRLKSDLRLRAIGDVDEANAAMGLARLHTKAAHPEIDAVLGIVQNDLLDLGADLATLDEAVRSGDGALRIQASQVSSLEKEIDKANERLQPLRSFVLPGGTAAAAALHFARAVTRRAERTVVALAVEAGEAVNPDALRYVNRLSDYLFVAARLANDSGKTDVLWVPGQHR